MVSVDLAFNILCSVSSHTRHDSEYILIHPETTNGSYILRRGTSSTHKCSLDVRGMDSVLHFRIYSDQAGEVYVDGGTLSFPSLEALIAHYHQHIIGLETPFKLTRCCSGMTPSSLSMVRGKDELEVANDSLKFEFLLYNGSHHDVWYGRWHRTLVAIKVAKMSTVPQYSLLEIKIMKGLRHPSIVKLYAVCTVSYPITLVLEHWRNAVCLSDHLQKLKQQPSLKFILQVAAQIASAMEYLAQLNIAHCHLKASSIQLIDQQKVKVTNFHRSRVLQDGRASTFQVDPRWTAPETISFLVVNKKSDVWSFGILLHQIAACGQNLYNGINAEIIVSMLRNGYRLPRPSSCEEALYEIMMNCWRWDHEERPDFSQLLVAVQNLQTLGECILCVRVLLYNCEISTNFPFIAL